MKKILSILCFIFILNFIPVYNIVFGNSISEKDEEKLEEGIYEIYTRVSPTKVISVENTINNCGNVYMYERNNVNNQQFKISLNEDGTYTLIALHSNKAVDVQCAGKSNGTNIWQYESNGTDAQKWYIKESGNGYYKIISKSNNLCIDIPGASTKNGTNIQMYEDNGTKAQQFKFVKVQDLTCEKVIENGVYQIYSKVEENRVIEVPNSSIKNSKIIKTATNTGKANQKFKIEYNEDGYYTIKFLHTGKALDVQSAGKTNGTLVQQYDSNNTDAQKWIIVKNEDETYSIISKCNGLALDICSASKYVGTTVQTYCFNGTNAQKFTFEGCKEEKGTESLENATYRILSKADTNKVLDLEGASNSNGAVIQVWDNVKVIQQKFELQYIGDGYYKIISKKSDKVLTVESENLNYGSKIIQQEDNNLDTQKWILKRYSENVYAIVSKCGNMYITLGGEVIENGQDLKLMGELDSNTQKFIFVNETPKKDIVHIEDGIYKIALKSDKVLDVYDGRYTNAANIQIWSDAKVQQQKFRVSRVGDTDYYKINAIHSAKVLDVQGGNSNLGANINQYEENGTDNQYWLLKDCGDGYYNIISKANGLCLDITSGGINTSGNNVQLYYNNGTDAQKFKFIPVNIINNDTYEVETKVNKDKVIDIYDGSTADYANAQIWGADNVNQQRFIFEAISEEIYKIIAKHSNKALTVDINSNNVYQSTYTGANEQQWKIKEAGEGYYYMECVANGLVIDIGSNNNVQNGQNVNVSELKNSSSQKFRFITGFRKFYEAGIYGKSGLLVAGDPRGSYLKYYKYGKGTKTLFATFSIHGFEDSYAHDGSELTYIAEQFNNYLYNNISEDIVNSWTIYIFPDLNPDGQIYGWTNNGPGRTTLYSEAPQNKGIDMNRNWSVGYTNYSNARNYNGTTAFQAYEAKYLREFILNHQGSSNILVDTHGWLNETIGNDSLGEYYRKQFGISEHINSYGNGYLINWARTLTNTKSVLVELPEVKNHSQTLNYNYAQKYINATMNLLREN